MDCCKEPVYSGIKGGTAGKFYNPSFCYDVKNHGRRTGFLFVKKPSVDQKGEVMELLYTREALKQKAAGFSVVPVCAVVPGDMITPAGLLAKCRSRHQQVFLLESAEKGQRSRYSYVGLNPVEVLRQNAGDEPLTQRVNQMMAGHKSPRLTALPPFTGGLAGWLSYDTFREHEPILGDGAPDPDDFDSAVLMRFDELFVFDHEKESLLIIVNMSTDEFNKNFDKACARLELLAAVTDEKAEPGSFTLTSPIVPSDTLARYTEKIAHIQKHIIQGDIFQAVLSNRMRATMKGSLFPVYRMLRSENPSPYMFYFQNGETELAGSSPETLVRLDAGKLITCPIAGTRPRGRDAQADEAAAEDLRQDEKELSEHNMLVDLGRNDLGRVCSAGTVMVEKYLEIKKFSSVMHLTSQVTGRLEPGLTAADALGSLLPAGTLSGAPKIRACQIIDSLETERRGIYGGACGYISYTGDMDMCIIIRTAFRKKDALIIQSGGGIVADSVPETEYLETQHKAAAVLSAVRKAEELAS